MIKSIELSMRKGLICLLLMVYGSVKLYAQNADYESRVRTYIEQYSSWAIMEQKRSGIPAAITLAQGIHETSAGTSELATMANNHFGIKCKKEWTGETFAHTDDAPNECFRKYSRSEDSYKDHSDYLVKSPRYAELFKLSPTDYAAWAMGLKRCGYATNPRYAQVLIKLVEDYHLQEYTYTALNSSETGTGYIAAKAEVVPLHDKPAQTQSNVVAETKPVVIPPVSTPVTTTPVAVPVTQTISPAANTTQSQNSKIVTSDNTTVQPAATASLRPEYGQIVKVNGLRAIYGRKGDTPLEYAYRGDTRYSKFLEVNEIDERPLPVDMYLYLEKKNIKGTRPKHLVKPGETLFVISQEEGIQIKSLMDMNMLEPGEEPVAGTMLELQRMVTSKPTVAITKKNAAVVAPPQTLPASAQNVPVKTIKEAAKSTPEVTNTSNTTPVNVIEQVASQPVQQPASQEIAAVSKPHENDPTMEEAGKDPARQAVVPPSADGAPNAVLKEELVKETKSTIAEPQPMVMEPVTSVEPLPIQNASGVQVAQPSVVINKVAEPEVKREEEPEDELEKLKRKFDKVVYAKDNSANTQPAAIINETPKQDTVKAVVTEEKKSTILASSKDMSKYYTVKKGDTGHGIAKSHGITLRQLMEWNGLDFDDIKVGQKLRIKP